MTIGRDNREIYKNATDAIIELIDLHFGPCISYLKTTVSNNIISNPGKDSSYNINVNIDEYFNVPEHGISCSIIENNSVALNYLLNRLTKWLMEWTIEEDIKYSIIQHFTINFTLK